MPKFFHGTDEVNAIEILKCGLRGGSYIATDLCHAEDYAILKAEQTNWAPVVLEVELPVWFPIRADEQVNGTFPGDVVALIDIDPGFIKRRT